ncbi:MAG TPA: hypothetical protein VGD97_07320 [Lacunisphaera sp.]
MKPTTIRPILIGLALGAGTILSLGQMSANKSNQIGRYQIAGTSTGQGTAFIYILDTATGETQMRAWLQSTPGMGGKPFVEYK